MLLSDSMFLFSCETLLVPMHCPFVRSLGLPCPWYLPFFSSGIVGEQTASVCLEESKCTIAELYFPSTRENGRTMSYTRLVTRE